MVAGRAAGKVCPEITLCARVCARDRRVVVCCARGKARLAHAAVMHSRRVGMLLRRVPVVIKPKSPYACVASSGAHGGWGVPPGSGGHVPNVIKSPPPPPAQRAPRSVLVFLHCFLRAVSLLVCVLFLSPAIHDDDSARTAKVVAKGSSDSHVRLRLCRFASFMQELPAHNPKEGARLVRQHAAAKAWTHASAAAPLTSAPAPGAAPGTAA